MGFWSKFAHITEQLAPVILPFVPGLPPALIPLITSGIQAAEHIPGADGPAKKAHVLSLVHDGLDGVNALHGTTLVPSDAPTASVDAGITAVVSSVNAIRAAHAATTPGDSIK